MNITPIIFFSPIEFTQSIATLTKKKSALCVSFEKNLLHRSTKEQSKRNFSIFKKTSFYVSGTQPMSRLHSADFFFVSVAMLWVNSMGEKKIIGVIFISIFDQRLFSKKKKIFTLALIPLHFSYIMKIFYELQQSYPKRPSHIIRVGF